jgi:hypothetical protein
MPRVWSARQRPRLLTQKELVPRLPALRERAEDAVVDLLQEHQAVPDLCGPAAAPAANVDDDIVVDHGKGLDAAQGGGEALDDGPVADPISGNCAGRRRATARRSARARSYRLRARADRG